MPPALRPWFRLLRASFSAQARYLASVIGGLIANTTFGFLRASILFATVDAAGGALAGYDIGSIATYVWLGQALLGVIQLNGVADIGDRVRTGDIAVDFARPLDVQTAQLATDLGGNLFNVPTRMLPMLLIGALTTGLAMPAVGWPYPVGALSILLAMVISFGGRYAVNVIGFWILESRGPRLFYLVVSGFLAGLYVPVSLFPGWLHAVANCTPFPSMFMTPINILSGRLTGSAALIAVSLQVFWLVVTMSIGRLLTERGRLKLEVQGG